MSRKVELIYLAAGNSRRFGSNKLLESIHGKPMYQYGLEVLKEVLWKYPDAALTVVTEYDPIREWVEMQKNEFPDRICTVRSPEHEKGISYSIRAGLSGRDADYYLFAVADQPWICADTILELIQTTVKGGYMGGFVEWENQSGNPAIFARALVPELQKLTGDTGGKKILLGRKDVCRVQAHRAQEMKDIDETKDIKEDHTMNFLEERIQKDGIVKEGNVLKVDSFLNHQMDIHLMEQMGEEFKRRFEGVKVDKVLTIEASGIGIACFVAKYFDVPMVFAKKAKSINIEGEMYIAEVESFTHKCQNQVIVSQKFLNAGENVLLIDDFLANGCALQGLISIVAQAGANVAGIGIAIEKGFQSGGRTIRNLGYRLESLAIVEAMDPTTGKITFREQ
jgi:xanthine phosphoribosyltransferase